ncbi:hypothetical protein F4825DRAFT_466155 [Nemania diffusa]|nr:hypothetical protein F4825DRAFT_466155 [Nemania diffusa]
MRSSKRRVITSCIPCYTRKQKPHRGSDGCSDAGRPPIKRFRADEEKIPPAQSAWSGATLTESFGYLQYSESNTLSLVQKLGFARQESPVDCSSVPSAELTEEISRALEGIPDNQIIDFLVQFFVKEINWMDQLVHMPWFLARYQAISAMECVQLISDVDFFILVLRICSYALQFLPSPSYPLDKVRGVSLAELRSSCDDSAEKLESIRASCDHRGSLAQVQQLAFLGLKCQVEGSMIAFWEILGRAIRVAQSIGIHSDGAGSLDEMKNVEREMARRTFCTLYIWDSLLSRRLGRVSFLPGPLSPGNWPQLHLLTCGRVGGTDREAEAEAEAELAGDAPDLFTERLLQARLADFWRDKNPVKSGEYDGMAAEEQYDNFRREYLQQLPPAFSLEDPDKSWDKMCPTLPLQRKLLHVAIYDALCWNFRPLLMRRPCCLPAYKAVLLDSQKNCLAVAALRVMGCIKELHSLLGGCHTRQASIVVSTFEAGVLLIYLLSELDFLKVDPGGKQPHASTTPTITTVVSNIPDPLQADSNHVTRNACLQAVQGGLKRLKMLAEVSNRADLGANVMAQMLSKVPETNKASKRTAGGITLLFWPAVTMTSPGPDVNDEARDYIDPVNQRLLTQDLITTTGYTAGNITEGEVIVPWLGFDASNMY